VSGVIKLENLSFVGVSAGIKWLSRQAVDWSVERIINFLNAELNPICHLLALFGAHPILHISRIRVNLAV